MRIAAQQQLIANLVTADSEQRLGLTLLQLAHKLGKKDVCDFRLEYKTSQDELSEMVGTTRPRITMFMQHFRNMKLGETSAERFLTIKENKLMAYLNSIA